MRAWFRWDWVRVTVLLWFLLVAGLAVDGYLHSWRHTVYNIYAVAARHWWAGRDMYVCDGEPYRYSPLFAILLTPFACLPDGWGNALWKVCNAVVFAAGLWTWGRRVVPAALSRNQLAALFVLALPLALHSMYIGQANLAMIGAVLLGLGAVQDGRWNQSAGWLAWATLVKGYPLALALILAAMYPRRLAGRFLAALGLGLLLPFAAQRPAVALAQYASWWGHLHDSAHLFRERLRSIDHLFQLGGYPLTPQAFALLGLAAGGVVLGVCLWQALQSGDPRQQLTRCFVLFGVWVVLFGPATESCTYAVMAPAAAWTLVDAFRRRTGWGIRLLLAASLLMMGLLSMDTFGQTVRNFANAHGVQPLGALLFLGCLVADRTRARWTTRLPQLPQDPAPVRGAA
jgi:hypothetical protein